MNSKIYSYTLNNNEACFKQLNYAKCDFAWMHTDKYGNIYKKIGFGKLISYKTKNISELKYWWSKLSSYNAQELIKAFISISFDPLSSWGSKLTVPKCIFEQTKNSKKITFYSYEKLNKKDIFQFIAKLIGSENKSYKDTNLKINNKSLSDIEWMKRVSKILFLIKTTDLEKVVFSRKFTYFNKNSLSIMNILNNLFTCYPECWTFVYENFVGATPEILIELSNKKIKSKILAGTKPRSLKNGSQILQKSQKEQNEHNLAVKSLIDKLKPFIKNLVLTGPFILELKNVWHLASLIKANLSIEMNILDIAELIHPTAAVGGYPHKKAIPLVRELENYDRGPYAGPIGWIDSKGEGQLGVALRCGIIENNKVSLFAGSGIVAGSSPDKEIEEINNKMKVMKDALTFY